ncbi:hypothetical protein QAD02_020235 [Eretmocerus hayati]|uniref:Uncharacterized protein n=1 Tax=Eretmocerus hayati TaxID=131215 RepID=A0ACC2PLY8_9HYME|nr:hypothetical protein QAD02_020235 [Eretmocerus hayati]
MFKYTVTNDVTISSMKFIKRVLWLQQLLPLLSPIQNLLNVLRQVIVIIQDALSDVGVPRDPSLSGYSISESGREGMEGEHRKEGDDCARSFPIASMYLLRSNLFPGIDVSNIRYRVSQNTTNVITLEQGLP